MKCPFCGDQESKVVDSRHSEDGQSIRRRRECLNCQRRFTTYEVVEILPIIVVKRDGTRQAFDRNKILNAMVRAFDKRKVDVKDLDHHRDRTDHSEHPGTGSHHRYHRPDGYGAHQVFGRGGLYPFCLRVPSVRGCAQLCPRDRAVPGREIRSFPNGFYYRPF